mgnify:CR=1 FL=1
MMMMMRVLEKATMIMIMIMQYDLKIKCIDSLLISSSTLQNAEKKTKPTRKKMKNTPEKIKNFNFKNFFIIAKILISVSVLNGKTHTHTHTLIIN